MTKKKKAEHFSLENDFFVTLVLAGGTDESRPVQSNAPQKLGG